MEIYPKSVKRWLGIIKLLIDNGIGAMEAIMGMGESQHIACNPGMAVRWAAARHPAAATVDACVRYTMQDGVV
jgi:hypothetical protein